MTRALTVLERALKRVTEQWNAFNRDSRGVTNVTGYVMVLGIMLTVITGVSVVGVDAITDREQRERVTAAQYGFEAVSENTDAMMTRGDESKTTTVPAADGTVRYGENITVTIGKGTRDAFTSTTHSVETPTIRYENGAAGVRFEGGVVVRVNGDGGPSTSETRPGTVMTSDRAVLPVVVITPVRPGVNIAASRAVDVTTTRTGANNGVSVESSGGDVWVRVNTTHHAAWKTALRDDGFEHVHVTDDGGVRGEFVTETGTTPGTVQLVSTRVNTEVTPSTS